MQDLDITLTANRAQMVLAAQAIAAIAWDSRIDDAVQSFKRWELASKLMRLAYLKF